MKDDDKWLLAWRKAGMSDEMISARLCIPLDEIEKRIQAIESAQKSRKKIGIENLADDFTATCFQYQLVGEGLKRISQNLSFPVSPSEILEKIHPTDPHQTVQNLLSSFIILHPWKSEIDDIELTQKPDDSQGQ